MPAALLALAADRFATRRLRRVDLDGAREPRLRAHAFFDFALGLRVVLTHIQRLRNLFIFAALAARGHPFRGRPVDPRPIRGDRVTDPRGDEIVFIGPLQPHRRVPVRPSRPAARSPHTTPRQPRHTDHSPPHTLPPRTAGKAAAHPFRRPHGCTAPPTACPRSRHQTASCGPQPRRGSPRTPPASSPASSSPTIQKTLRAGRAAEDVVIPRRRQRRKCFAGVEHPDRQVAREPKYSLNLPAGCTSTADQPPPGALVATYSLLPLIPTRPSPPTGGGSPANATAPPSGAASNGASLTVPWLSSSKNPCLQHPRREIHLRIIAEPDRGAHQFIHTPIGQRRRGQPVRRKHRIPTKRHAQRVTRNKTEMI